MPPVFNELGHSLDEILLVRLAQCEPVEPSLPAELVEAVALLCLWEHDEQPLDPFTGARPLGGSFVICLTAFR